VKPQSGCPTGRRGETPAECDFEERRGPRVGGINSHQFSYHSVIPLTAPSETRAVQPLYTEKSKITVQFLNEDDLSEMAK